MTTNNILVSVCAGCGMSQIARDSKTNEPACPICGVNQFISVTLPDELKCNDCNTVTKTEKILRMWKLPPFYKHGKGTYYCGCKG